MILEFLFISSLSSATSIQFHGPRKTVQRTQSYQRSWVNPGNGGRPCVRTKRSRDRWTQTDSGVQVEYNKKGSKIKLGKKKLKGNSDSEQIETESPCEVQFQWKRTQN